MRSLVVHSALAARLLVRQASQMFSTASAAHPRRKGEAPHPEHDAAARLLTKAREAQRYLEEGCESMAIFVPDLQDELAQQAIARISADPANIVRLSPRTPDQVYTWQTVGQPRH